MTNEVKTTEETKETEIVKTEKKEKKEKKKGGATVVLLAVICVLLVCSIGATCVFAALSKRADDRMVDSIGKIEGKLDQVSEKVGVFDEEAEDGIVIMDEYKIESTLPISDAYKSGDTSALSDRDKETLSMASAVLDEIIEDGMTDYEREVAVYKWLTSEMTNDVGLLTVIPTTGADSDNPYGVLKYRNAVCVGYATTFRLFMQMLDIECRVVHSLDRIHSWDLVNLEGDWYHVDCYMDSGTSDFRSFNMSDSVAEGSHDWNRDFFPAATGEKYSYTMMNSVEIESFRSIPEWVKGLLDEESEVGSCWFTEKIGKDSEAEAAILASTLFDTLNWSAMYEDHWFDYYWSESEEKGYMLTVYISYPGGENYDDPDDFADEELYDKANELIGEVFGEEVFEQSEYYDDDEDWYEEDYEDGDVDTGAVYETDENGVTAVGDFG